MQELTGKQKSFLRGLGQRLEPLLTVGKAGASPAVSHAIDELLVHRELVKLRLPPGSAQERKALAEQLAADARAVCAGVVGRTALLWRPNEQLPPPQRIHPPAGH